MGSAHTKPSSHSPKRPGKSKLENGHAPKPTSGFEARRNSTGQRPIPLPGTGSGYGGERNKLLTIEENRDDVVGVGGDDGDMVGGWPKWFIENVPKEVFAGLVPKSADSYEKIDKVGQGTYSNVYKARDRDTGKVVALKKVRFDTSEPESVKFMAREIMILQKLDHPNVLKLEGLATSRMQYSIYLVFEFMHSDLARVICRPDGGLTEAQVKCYTLQLLSGLQHCHERGILHRDIKGSNLLIDNSGMLKIGDFGLANYYNPKSKQPLTSRVVTLWYRAPELLLGATNYGVGIDLWSVGCLLAEMFAGRPIMPGRTEVEQLHRIFRLCGTPSEDYWRKLRLSTTFRPPQGYKPCLREAFKDFPLSSLGLLSSLLALDPAYRGSATLALQNDFFSSSPLACDLSGLPAMYTEEDGQTPANEQRKHKNSKMKQRSHTYRERRRRDSATDKPDEDPVYEKERNKSRDPAVPIQEPRISTSSMVSSAKARERGSSTSSTSSGTMWREQSSSASSSNSSGGKPAHLTGNHFLVSPSKNVIPRVEMLRTRATTTTTDDKDNDKVYRDRVDEVNRSVSTRELRNTNRRSHLQL